SPSLPVLHPLSLHDALPIWTRKVSAPPVSFVSIIRAGGLVSELEQHGGHRGLEHPEEQQGDERREVEDAERRDDAPQGDEQGVGDRKSTRLNSSHQIISYAV